MQKKNPVIKNYIISSEKYFLPEKTVRKSIGNFRYHVLSKQNMEIFYLFPLRK